MSVPKWSQKLALVKLLWFFFQYIYLKNVNFRRVLIFKKTFIATSSEACALTPSKCFAEEFKNVQNWSEKKINLVPLLCSCLWNFNVRNNNFLTFFISERIFSGYLQWKLCAHLQKIFDWTRYGSCKMIKNHKFPWLLSYIFILEFYPQIL